MDYTEDYPNIREEIDIIQKRYHSKNNRIIRRMIAGYLLGMALILPHSLDERHERVHSSENYPTVRSRTNLTLACCGAVVVAGSLLTGLFLSIQVEGNEGKRLEELESEKKKLKNLDEL
jgi:hypothetical protein